MTIVSRSIWYISAAIFAMIALLVMHWRYMSSHVVRVLKNPDKKVAMMLIVAHFDAPMQNRYIGVAMGTAKPRNNSNVLASSIMFVFGC